MSLINEDETLFQRPINNNASIDLPSEKLLKRVELSGLLVTLEPLNSKLHGKDLFEEGHSTLQGSDIWKYMPYGPWADLSSYTKTLEIQEKSQDPIFYAIRLHSTGKVCGQISFMDINASNGSAEIGHIWFGPKLQRTRAATEALFLAIDYPMSELRYRRMQWRCNSLNKGSRKAAVRLGFKFEGVSYNHMIVKGKNRDTAWYSILDKEWPKVKQKFITWLSEENFDENGQAKTSLTSMMK